MSAKDMDRIFAQLKHPSQDVLSQEMSDRLKTALQELEEASNRLKAVFQDLQVLGTQEKGREILGEVQSKLGLTLDQVGRMLEVQTETVRRWHQREVSVPTATLAALSAIEDAMKRLTQMFLPERLPQVIRRPAEMFDGRMALDWILEGRIREVADRYDLLLRYQG